VTTLSNLVGWVLAGFYSVIPNFGVAIILLGITFMAVVAPLTLKSTRSMLAMQKLQPQMKQLQQQYKNDRVALNQALTQLYKDEGVSPFGSCIPTLIPLPLFYVLYRVIQGLASYKCSGIGPAETCVATPKYINPHTRIYHALRLHAHVENAAQIASVGKHGAPIPAFGMNLANDAWTAITKHLGAGQVFGALFLLLVMIAANYYQQIQITNLNPMVQQNQQANPQMRMMRFFPIVFGLLCVRFPSALVLYYAVTALFRVGQQWMMYKYDPKVKALVARDERDLEVIEQVERKKLPGQETGRAATGQAALAVTTQANGQRPNGQRSNGRRSNAKQPVPRQGDSRPQGRYQGAGNAPRSRCRRRRGR
jgi:YidC/Oxa1 family membrane protein insertase